MKAIGDLLAPLSLPLAGPCPDGRFGEADWIHDLGADLPAGHLHLWGGPQGAGKTSFLLSLTAGAALRGRRVLYATYHLSAESLALRLLAMTAAVDAHALATGHLGEAAAARAAAARACIARWPYQVLEARGLTSASLEDRLVRMAYRPEVVAVDYLQAVRREPDVDAGATVRRLSSLASRLHLAVVVAIQGVGAVPEEVSRLADRAGWIAPAGGSGLRRAEVIRNRYGERPAVGFRLDESTGVLEPLDPGRSDSRDAGAGAP